MDAIDFFNSDELELPRSWNKIDLQFDDYLKKIFEAYIKILNSLNTTDYVTHEIISRKGDAVKLAVYLERIVNLYYEGKIIQAYELLNEILIECKSYLETLITGSVDYYSFKTMFRIRLGDYFDYKREDLFHIKFEDRYKVKTQRYSIPGLPCLYLGGSVFICWEEMNRPDFSKIHSSGFVVKTGETIKVLDFGYRPAHIAAYLVDPKYSHQLTVKSKASDFAISQAICWPLIAACSIATKHKDAPFKSEYILPQLLLQWITHNNNINGIRYFSTHVVGGYDYFHFSHNYAFPVKSKKNSGYCDYLKSKFYVSNPLHWPLAMSFNLGVNLTPNAHVKIKLMDDEEVSYINSEFEEYESKICGQNFKELS